jgi:hypothetical protein
MAVMLAKWPVDGQQRGVTFLKNKQRETERGWDIDIAEDQPNADPLRAQPEPKAEQGECEGSTARKILGLENAVDTISDAEKPISQRICESAI